MTAHQACVDIEIPFHDVDMLNITWHGHYLKYFEIARCKLLNQIGYGYKDMAGSGYAWPIIEATLRYIHAAHFGQTVRVQATLKEWENRLKIDYQISDAATGQRLTRGHTIQVAVNIQTRELCLASPAVLTDKLGAENA